MNLGDKAWKVLYLFVLLLTAFIPAYVAYDLYGRGPAPEKEKIVEVFRFFINPLDDLSVLGEKAKLTLNIKNQTINNLLITKAFFRNAGKSPILPNDFHENLSINVDQRWKIIAVENGDPKPNIALSWTRVSDTRFEAKPFLMNPGDMVFLNIYLTDTQYTAITTKEKSAEPNVNFRARIANLRYFQEPPSFSSRIEKRAAAFAWILIELSGWSLVFTIIAAILFQALYLHLLSKAGFLRNREWRSIILAVGASVLSFAAAESCATYLFGNRMTDIVGVSHSMNAPWIVLHVLVLVFLYVRVCKLSRSALTEKIARDYTN